MTGKSSTPTIPLTSYDDQDALPGPDTLEAFGVKGGAVPLAGGQGKSFKVADTVLKAVDDYAFVQATRTIATTATTLRGWTPFEFLPESVGPEEKLKEPLDVSLAFHEGLRDFQHPTFLPYRSHPWAVADRVAWSEASIEINSPLRKAYSALVNHRVDVSVRPQTIHGNLTEELSPLVIGFSPYWRPVKYADAIIIADGLLNYDRDRSLVELGLQMLVRPLIFRLVAANTLRDTVSEKEVRLFERALEIVRIEIHRNAEARLMMDLAWHASKRSCRVDSR